MKKISFEAWGRTVNCDLSVEEYANGGVALQLWEDGGPYSGITVWLETLPEGYAYLDTNNFPQAVEIMQEYGLGEPTGTSRRSGFCAYPLYKLNIDAIRG